MENATKALLISAGVLIGVLILSVGVTLYTSLGSYIDSYQKEIDERAIQKFHEQFTRYINVEDGSADTKFTLTIQDIVTVASIAYQNNQKYQLEEYENDNYYVTVKMPGNGNVEKNINEYAAELLKKYTEQKYKCTINDVKVNQKTRRVYEIKFSEDSP